jgi:branched-chain amino acid aminotransferase
MVSPVSSLSWFNGSLVGSENIPTSIASPTLHYGVGVFDGLMAYWNRDHHHLLQGSEHLARFTRSCERLGLNLPWSMSEIQAGVGALLAALPRTDWYLRPLAFRSRPQLELTGVLDRLPGDLAILAMEAHRGAATPLRCAISAIERVSGSAVPVPWKICGAYANSYLARRDAQLAGFDDGLMLDREGRICEASASNVFFLESKALVTPALTPDIFPGITRTFLLETARRLGLETRERAVYPAELGTFEGAFLGATLMEMRPLQAIGDHLYASAEHPVFRLLWEEFCRAREA